MAEPLSTSATVGTVAGWGIVTSALVGFITSVDYSIAFGEFAGSMCFIVTVSDLTRRQIFGYFLFGYAAVVISAAAVQSYFWLKNGGVSKLPFVKKWLGEKS